MATAKSVVVPAVGAATGGITTAVGAANALPILGFGSLGVKAASLAAFVQSTCFGAAVPAGSWFATMTSLGATGAMTAPLIAVAAPVGAVVGGVAAWYYVQGGKHQEGSSDHK